MSRKRNMPDDFAVDALSTEALRRGKKMGRPDYSYGKLVADTTEYEREQIVDAYDEMMDFCTGRTETFSVGVLGWSESGRDHFVDVRGLFLLDLWAAGVTGALLLGWLILRRRTDLRPYRFRNRGPAFWGCVGLGAAFLSIGGLAALDFDRAFVIFHALFFPGKDNWIFDWREDPVILLLPQEFFRNCAILILALLLVWCVVLIGADLWAGRMRKKQEKLNQIVSACGNCADCSNCSGCPSYQKPQE